jgi:hypothetical protein
MAKRKLMAILKTLKVPSLNWEHSASRNSLKHQAWIVRKM